MIAPNMSNDKYRKMPRSTKVIYWTIVAGVIGVFLYFGMIKFEIL